MKNLMKNGRKKNTLGFTMVELIVVICIILILAGIAIFGISSWINWVHFKEQNENARTLYSAAQNQIGEYSAHGQLESKVQEKVMTDTGYRNVIDFDTMELIGADGKIIGTKTLWPASIGKTNAAQYIGTVCYAMGTEADYKTYCDNPDKLDADGKSEIRMMYDMLVPYLYDPSILKASVCMEFTPDDGQIYSVFYSNIGKNSENYFKYQDDNTTRGQVSIYSRMSDYREKRMVGYYGVGSLSKIIGTNAGKPVFSDVRLNNEETLNLSFKVGGVGEAIKYMTYTVSLYDKYTGMKRMDILLDGSKLQPAGSYSKTKIESHIIRYREDGITKWQVDADDSNPTKFPFIIEQLNDNTLRIILDAADISASGNLYKQSMPELTNTETGACSDVYRKYINTYSFSRFGIIADDIYCTVQGAGSVYKTTTKKQSNSSSVYFETSTKVDDELSKKTMYTVANGRHLYNIRYLEDGDIYSGTNVEYRINRNIDWNQFVDNKGLYYTSKIRELQTSDGIYSVIYNMEANNVEPLQTSDRAIPFPSIGELRKDSVLTSNSVAAAVIKNIVINEDDNRYTLLYADTTGNGADNKGPVGIFAVNKGTIHNVALDRVKISGTDNVGAFCGNNEGNLMALSVNNSGAGDTDTESRIEGNDNVGGIAGNDVSDSANMEKMYLRLNNYAVVSGHESVGGIVGKIYLESGSETSLLIDGCRNYGEVKAKEVKEYNDTARTECKYIGGIAGYAENNAQQDKIQFVNCTGLPIYTDEEIKDIFSDEASLKVKLNGLYVGGIAGYNKNTVIKECNAQNLTGNGSYLFGYMYVGGIVGYNDGTISTAEISGSNVITGRGIIDTNVIGYQYVGGVCGANNIRITDWNSRGMVAATGGYAGGITGYNGENAFVENCICNTAAGRIADNIDKTDFLKGDYVGGIAGYNKGTVTADNAEIITYATGKDYVGGVVGYNDTKAVVAGYNLTGGYVKGTGAFVGGIIGLNASADIFYTDENTAIEKTIDVNPNEVSGDFCVGGVIGGNIVSLSDDRYVKFHVDNFLGSVTAEAFAGGYIGYNHLFQKETDEEQIKNYAETICKIESDADTWDAPISDNVLRDKYAEVIINLRNTDTVSYKDSDRELVITGGTDNNTTSSRLEEIKVRIYAGGIVGYNAESTRLRIKNIINNTAVTASVITENDYENPLDKNNIPYSYSGGIISKVTKNAVVEKCENRGEGNTVSDGGKYFGGICEVNEGMVMDCPAPAAGSSKRDYVGGIAGLNKKNGQIIRCYLRDDVTVTGNSYVGGIAAENYGIIKDTGLNGGKIKAYGSYVGGITADNYGSILFENEKEADIVINALGKNGEIGGLIGKNESKATVSYNPDDKFVLKGNIGGEKTVGGIIGNNNSSNVISKWDNHATVTAVKGNAGGIAGVNHSSIKNCMNNGIISATTAGDAGGIVAENVSTIEDCTNKGKISSANGDAGGIAALNGSTIKNSKSVGTTDEYCEIEGLNNTGGIAGDNRSGGTIEACMVKHVKVFNTKDSGEKESNVGGIAGMNEYMALVSGIIDKVTVADSSVISNVSGNNINIGGAIGKTQGAAENITVSDNTVINLADNISYANMGGIAGIGNGGNIEGCTVKADISGNMGSSDTGYGGIAGTFRGTKISSCRYSGSLTANGSSDNMVYMGGIAGRLHNGSNISGCYIGTDEDTVIMSGHVNGNDAAGYVGGIAGINEGNITDSGYKEGSSHKVNITNRAGNTGGITGELANTGSINGCETGYDWKVLATWYISTGGTGGIIGYSSAGTDINNCINRAEVTAEYKESDNVATAGLIGRLENTSRNGMVINGFVNYGDINGTMAGGAIGRDKFKGITFNNCINYGTITSAGEKSKAAGGIVGNFMVNSEPDDYIVFNSCINHGNIVSAQNAGGITGYAGSDSVVRVTYYDCVNTGAINVKNDSYGGITCSTTNQEAYFYRCRNYGNTDREKNDAGIVRTGNGIQRVWDCFNFGFVVTDKQIKSLGLVGEKINIASFERNYYVKSGDNPKRGYGLTYNDSNSSSRYLYYKEDNNRIIKGLTHDVCNNMIRSDIERIKKDGYTITNMNDAGNAGYYRLKNYLGIEPSVKAYYEELESSSDKLCDITDGSINVKNTGGHLTAEWKHGNKGDAYIYSGDQIMYKIGDGEWQGPFDVAYGVELYTINNADTNSKDITIAVRTYGKGYDTSASKAADWFNKYGPDKNVQEPYAGKWVIKTCNSRNGNQAIPQVHIEFTPTKDNNKAYTAILDNPEDYEGDRATAIMITGIQGKINGNDAAPGTIEFNTDDGHSELFTVESIVDDNGKVKTSTLNIKAEANDNYAESMITSYMAAFYGDKNLKDEDHVDTVFKDFFGNTPGGISAQIIMDSQPDRNTEMYVDSELVVNDYPVGTGNDGNQITLPVAVASGNTHVTTMGGEVASVLDRLPNDAFNYGDITVRTYPWKTQSYICWYGHPIENGDKNTFTKEEIIEHIEKRSLKDIRRNENVFIDKDGKAALNEGYVLRLNGDGTYSVIYSSILDYRDVYGTQIDEKVYTADHKNGQIMAGDSYNKKLLTAPAIEKDLELSEDGNSYTFTWDKENPDEKAVYELQLIGHDTDGAAGTVQDVLLKTVTVDKNTSDTPMFSYTFIDENNNWNYSDITLSVVRKGVSDASGKTEAFPAYSKEDFRVRVRFSQIAAPTVSLHRNNGITDKDTLIYDVSWNTVPESQRNEVDYYELLIETFADDGTLKTETRECNADNSADTMKAAIDLNGYEGGQKIRLSVHAIAKEDAETYRDGIKGVVREMTLPTRQQTPDVTKLTTQPEYIPHDESGDITYMTMEEFEKGLKLVLENDAADIDNSGRYELAAAIYNVHYEGDDTILMKEGDAKDPLDESHWNSGAYKTLITKESRTVMSGNLNSAVYNITSGIDSEDAGKWLKIALRNISDNNISSWWSDEDASGLTPNYKWLRIPRIQVDEAAAKEVGTEIFYDMNTGKWSKVSSKNVYEAAVMQTTLEFGIMKHADSYHIQRISLSSNTTFEDTVYARQDIDWIYLEPSDKEGIYNVFAVTSEDGSAEPQQENADIPVCEEDDMAVFVGELKKGSYVELPISDVLPLSSNDNTGINMASILYYKAGKGDEEAVIGIVMPDAERISISGETYENPDNYYHTSQVSIQAAVLGKEHLESYESAPICNWYRIKKNNKWTTGTVTLKDYNQPPVISDVKIEKSEYEGIAYNVVIPSEKRQVYQVTVVDSDKQTILDKRYIGSYNNGGDAKETLIALREDIYNSYKNKFIIFKGADITTGEGVSKWSEDTEPKELPE